VQPTKNCRSAPAARENDFFGRTRQAKSLHQFGIEVPVHSRQSELVVRTNSVFDYGYVEQPLPLSMGRTHQAI
jgi:hypothetical protein